MCFLVCSSFPLLANQTVLEFPLGRATSHHPLHRQKLAVSNDAATLLHTNRRD